MPRLVGRTFSNSIERGDYKSQGRACLDAEDVAFILVRWVVDIYHNSPHRSLGGRTPLEQWDADMEDGNYPLSGLPVIASKCLAFGKRLEWKVSQEGIVVMGVKYQSPELGMYLMGMNPKTVDVRWDPENRGAINVYLEGAWYVVPSVYDRFVGMHFHDWMKVRRALRAKSASRKAWNQEIVFNAIDQIEDLVKDRSMAFGFIDTTISDAQFKKIEEDFFSSFRIDDTPRLKADGQDLGRVIKPRAPDPDIAPTGSKASVKATVVKPSHDVRQPEEAAGTVHTLSKGRATATKFGLPPKREGCFRSVPLAASAFPYSACPHCHRQWGPFYTPIAVNSVWPLSVAGTSVGDLLAEAIDRSWSWRSSVSKPRGCKGLFPARRHRPNFRTLAKIFPALHKCERSERRGVRAVVQAKLSTEANDCLSQNRQIV